MVKTHPWTQRTSPPPPDAPPRILLIEDDSGSIFFYTNTIKKVFPDCTLDVAQTFQEAMKYLEDHTYNALISDSNFGLGNEITTPEHTYPYSLEDNYAAGLQVLKAVRQDPRLIHNRNVPTFYHSSQPSAEIIERAHALGVEACVKKPGSMDHPQLELFLESLKSRGPALR